MRHRSPTHADRPLAAAAASMLGWSFDLYDLFLLLYVAAPVAATVFPDASTTTQLGLVFSTFAVSVLMRPFGAAVFGVLADRHGRKKIMVIVLVGVGVSTAAMGLTPTYAAAGMLAPIVFIMFRIVQGFLVGGVSAVTHTLGTESVPARFRGLTSGLVGAGGAGLGAAMASMAFIVVSALFPGEAFMSTGWRVLFFTGLLSSALALFVALRVTESPRWTAEARARAVVAADGSATPAPIAGERRPPVDRGLREVVTGRLGRVTALNIVVAAGGGAQYYLISGFFPTLLDVVVPVPRVERGWILLIGSMTVIVAAAVSGALSERFGRRAVMTMFGSASLVVLPLVTWLLSATAADDTGRIIALVCCGAFLANAVYAPVLIFLNERYPTRLRSRGTAISWNTGFMLGGLTPTVVTSLSDTPDDIPSRLVVAVVVSALCFLIAVRIAPETRGGLDVADPVTGPGSQLSPAGGEGSARRLR